ncbi:hypothetical protein THAOC_13472 [Thalassiosira oceanica]|uniref:Uncharacterized protein n=1 Tax=Thalassiosira oceanica TaxID=159749 RepID=K0T5J5_THAOC|nr:hypothetical protein THAOC_13472 [Thalassiosira oceanica]|eukprot:EJK65647.1 hypothetical protein THAOC_13472 [Thalassiosira oceanica]
MPKFYPPKPALQHATDFFEPKSQQYMAFTEDLAVACNDWIDNGQPMTENESKKRCWQLRCIVDDEEDSEDYLDEQSKLRILVVNGATSFFALAKFLSETLGWRAEDKPYCAQVRTSAVSSFMSIVSELCSVLSILLALEGDCTTWVSLDPPQRRRQRNLHRSSDRDGAIRVPERRQRRAVLHREARQGLPDIAPAGRRYNLHLQIRQSDRGSRRGHAQQRGRTAIRATAGRRRRRAPEGRLDCAESEADGKDAEAMVPRQGGSDGRGAARYRGLSL